MKLAPIITKIEIDNGLTEIHVKALVTFRLVDASFSHEFGIEYVNEIDPDAYEVEILSCQKVSPFGTANFEPRGEELARIHQKLIAKAYRSIT